MNEQQLSSAPPPRPASPSEQPSPPHSPITPRAIAAQLAAMEPYNPPRAIPQPAPVPIAESDNPDVVALRSALMILQMQRETARRDIKELQRMRDDAVRDPEAYVKELVERTKREEEKRKLKGRPPEREDLLAPTLKYVVQGLGEDAELLKTEKKEESTKMEGLNKERSGDDADSSSDEEDDDSKTSKFGAPPKPQNIYRMPPVNWAKYQVAGPSLDRLHEEQRARPAPGHPALPEQGDGRAEPYMMAGPYLSVVDAARFGTSSEHPMQTRRGMKKQ